MRRMSDITRTQWLLITLIGLLVWFFGWLVEVPVVAIIGLFATLIGVVGAFFGRSRS